MFPGKHFGLRQVFFVTTAIWLIGGGAIQFELSSGYGNPDTLYNLHTIFVTGFGGIAILSGVILFGRWVWTKKRDDLSQWPSNLAKAASGSVSSKRQSSIDDDERFVNPARWDALSRFDPEISAAVDKLRPYGEKWIDEFRRSYFALDEDRSYLSSIVNKLLDEAKKEKAEAARFERLCDGTTCSEESMGILEDAKRLGYSIEVGKDNTILAKKSRTTHYLHSNYEIKRFAVNLGGSG